MCDYCEKEVVIKTNYITIQLQKVLPISNKQMLVKCNGCPTYAECSKMIEKINNVFDINYCPMCGRKLGE